MSLKDFRIKLSQYTKTIEEDHKSLLVLRKSKPVFRVVPIDHEDWATIADFTEISQTGAPVQKVLAALKGEL